MCIGNDTKSTHPSAWQIMLVSSAEQVQEQQEQGVHFMAFISNHQMKHKQKFIISNLKHNCEMGSVVPVNLNSRYQRSHS